MAKYRGTGQISSADYKHVKYVGKTKGGQAVTITLEKAINLGNIDWTFAEKDDTVAEIVMTAVYRNTDEMATDTKEPWTVEIDGEIASASKGIMTGVGIFYIDDTAIALSRGGGKFTVEREFREINADGDRGPVEDRIIMEGSRATLTMNTLQILTRLADLYPGLETVAAEVVDGTEGEEPGNEEIEEPGDETTGEEINGEETNDEGTE